MWKDHLVFSICFSARSAPLRFKKLFNGCLCQSSTKVDFFRTRVMYRLSDMKFPNNPRQNAETKFVGKGCPCGSMWNLTAFDAAVWFGYNKMTRHGQLCWWNTEKGAE
jgi:hypothetical protein